jgi:hypothetical protein
MTAYHLASRKHPSIKTDAMQIVDAASSSVLEMPGRS